MEEQRFIYYVCINGPGSRERDCGVYDSWEAASTRARALRDGGHVQHGANVNICEYLVGEDLWQEEELQVI